VTLKKQKQNSNKTILLTASINSDRFEGLLLPTLKSYRWGWVEATVSHNLTQEGTQSHKTLPSSAGTGFYLTSYGMHIHFTKEHLCKPAYSPRLFKWYEFFPSHCTLDMKYGWRVSTQPSSTSIRPH